MVDNSIKLNAEEKSLNNERFKFINSFFFSKELTILLEIKHFFHDQLTVHLLENQFTQNCRTVRSHFLTPSSIYIVIQYSSLNNCSSEIRTHMDTARVFPCVVCTNKHLIAPSHLRCSHSHTHLAHLG